MQIETEYSADALIREDEMKNLWGPDHLPPKELVDYWKTTLTAWISEYTGGCVERDVRGDTVLDSNSAKPGLLVGVSIPDHAGKTISVVLLSRRDGENGESPRWMFCPVSRYSVPATMWEFYVNTAKTGRIVVESWNIGTVQEDELFKVAMPVDCDNVVPEKDVEKISHAFERMMNTEFQDIPMMEVGPRVFLLNDPRRNYQRDEKIAYDFLRKLGGKTKEEVAEGIAETVQKSVSE